MSEKDIEKEIQDKNLNAPRLTPALIDAAIVNGFTVHGEAGVVSKANFNEEIGRKISKENARSKVWELEGYLLQQKVFEGKV